MRKLLLATSALAGVAMIATGAQAAAPAPVTVNVNGYVDFRAGLFHEDKNNNTPLANSASASRRDMDFETEWKVNVDVEGKAANGVEYGGRVSIWNGSSYIDGGNGGNSYNHNSSQTNTGTGGRADQAYVYMTSNYGKLIVGDEHGASDLFVYAPTIGANQVDGVYTDFTDPASLWAVQPAFFDNIEDSTKVTYYTPQLGNDEHKVQLGASFTPNQSDEGQNVVKYQNSAATSNGTLYAPYENLFEAGIQYTGSFDAVNVVLSSNVITGSGETLAVNQLVQGTADQYQDFLLWGIGGQVMYAGFTVGGSYVDAGRFNTVNTISTGLNQNKDQTLWSAGVSYGADNWALAFSYLGGEGYNNAFAVNGNVPTSGANTNYVEDINVYGFGGTYTWFPGMSTNVDLVFFEQDRADNFGSVATAAQDNSGQVFVLTQKLEF